MTQNYNKIVLLVVFKRITITEERLRDIFVKVLLSKDNKVTKNQSIKCFKDILKDLQNSDYLVLKNKICSLTDNGNSYVTEDIIMSML